MKKINGLLIAFLMVICSTSFSQNNNRLDIDIRLKEIYSDAKLEYLKNNAPEKLDYYNLFLNSYCYISTSIPKNGIPKGDVTSIKLKDGKGGNIDPELFDINSFNILKYHIPLDQNKPIFYSIGTTGKYLVFISTEEFRSKIEAKK